MVIKLKSKLIDRVITTFPGQSVLGPLLLLLPCCVLLFRHRARNPHNRQKLAAGASLYWYYVVCNGVLRSALLCCPDNNLPTRF